MRGRTGDAAGFSIIEMIIAMMLLAVLALAILPLLIGATKASVVNKTLVAATSFANAQLAPIRAAYPNDSTDSSCDLLRSTYAMPAIDDPAGTGLKADVVIPACPDASEFPGAVTVTVTVYPSDAPSKILVTLPTKVLVHGQ